MAGSVKSQDIICYYEVGEWWYMCAKEKEKTKGWRKFFESRGRQDDEQRWTEGGRMMAFMYFTCKGERVRVTSCRCLWAERVMVKWGY